LAFGVAFVMKQPGILLGAFAFFYLVAQWWPKNARDWAPWARRLGMFLLGGALPFALTCALLYRAGVFHNFWFWIFTYARQYATSEPLLKGLRLLPSKFFGLLSFTPWLWILALVGVSTVFWNSAVRRRAVFVLGLLVFSFAAVCPSLYFRQHYFILMLPAVAILIAVAVTSAVRWLTAKYDSRWLYVLPVIVFAAAWVLDIHRNAGPYFELTPLQTSRLFYSPNPFLEAVPIAEYLGQHTAPTDTIMVLGSEPEIYFYAHRHSASGYIYTYSLMEDQAYWPAMQKQMMQEVEANRPAYVVFVDIRVSWLARPGTPQVAGLHTWMNQYVSKGYEEAGMVDLANPEARYFWGDEAREHRRPGREIRIFKRKS
ncbi:MAG: hypothetical protein ABSD64_12220, partial [Terriglobales bacterium]